MGEETDIGEPMSSEDVVAAEDVTANEPSKEHRRKRKKHLYKSLRELIEFYMGDVNLSKDRFMSQHIQGQHFVYVDLSLFLTFNKVRALTLRVEDLAKALSQSEILQVSEDGTQVCRKTPIMKKENEDDCTIYVEQLPPDTDHDMLTKMFSEYGIVDYVSMPRFSHSSKFKGFAFVEFKNPEYAKKALESFKMKGCCLSPQMAPEDLMSIKNFDQNKENKVEKAKSESDTATTKYKKLNVEKDSAETHKAENIVESKGESCVERAEGNVVFENERKKRKSCDTVENVSKKMKAHNFKEAETSKSEQSKGHKGQDCGKDYKEVDKNSDIDVENEKDIKKMTNKKKYKTENHDPTQPSPSDNSQQNIECEDKLQKKKLKRKHSEDEIADGSEVDNFIEEGAKTKRKKLKSEVDADSEISQSEGDNESAKQKKKRKKKKKNKKEHSTAITLGLKVLPKKEWKALRNRYLNMQRDMMRSLKQHLMHSKWEKNKAMGPENEEGSLKQTPKFTPVLGTVVKVTLDEAISSQTAANATKREMRIHPDIRYVDVTEGSPVVYLRAATPQLAASLVQSHHWPAMVVIQGNEESDYWNKMNVDREEKLKKNKSNQRGRTKLLKRAERYQSKHITTFE